MKVSVLCHEANADARGLLPCHREAVVLVDGTPACKACAPLSVAAVRSTGNEPEVTEVKALLNAERKRLNHVRDLAG